MREVKTRCPNCGRERHVPADSWSGLPQVELDTACEGGCSPLVASDLGTIPPASGPADRGSPMPALFAAAVVLAPIAGVVLALNP